MTKDEALKIALWQWQHYKHYMESITRYDAEDVKTKESELFLECKKTLEKKSCGICGCNISLKGYCAGCQTRI